MPCSGRPFLPHLFPLRAVEDSGCRNRGREMAFASNLALQVGGRSICSGPSISSRRPRYAVGVSSVRCAAANPNELLSTEELEEWRQVSALVCTVNASLQPDDADRLVGRAFGWGTQKFWRGDVKCEAPSLSQAKTSLVFLRETVGLDDDGVGAVLKKFPEVLRLRRERMVGNVEQIQRSYPNIKGKMLANSVKENPPVLGYDFDCEGDCKSECARCWVQF